MLRAQHASSQCLIGLLVLTIGLSASAGKIDDAALTDESKTEEWLAYGRTYSEQRFSPLDQINATNVSKLAVDWYIDLPEAVGLVATPLVADGVLYFVGSRNIVGAVNAVNGEVLWRYDPRVSEVAGNRMRVSFCTATGASRCGRTKSTSRRSTGA